MLTVTKTKKFRKKMKELTHSDSHERILRINNGHTPEKTMRLAYRRKPSSILDMGVLDREKGVDGIRMLTIMAEIEHESNVTECEHMIFESRTGARSTGPYDRAKVFREKIR